MNTNSSGSKPCRQAAQIRDGLHAATKKMVEHVACKEKEAKRAEREATKKRELAELKETRRRTLEAASIVQEPWKSRQPVVRCADAC